MLNQGAHLIVCGLDELRGVLDVSVISQGLAGREDSAAGYPLGPQIAEEPPLVAQPVRATRLGEQLVEGVTMRLRYGGPGFGGALRERVVRVPNIYVFHGAADRVEQDLRHLWRVWLPNILAVDRTVADEFEVGGERRADLAGQLAQRCEHVASLLIGRGDQRACPGLGLNGPCQAFELISSSSGDGCGALQEAQILCGRASGPFLSVY